jgi:hypothetical protein
MTTWHKLSEKLPPIGEPVLTYTAGRPEALRILKLTYLFNKVNPEEYIQGEDEEQLKSHNIYWMELPKLPGSEE